MYYSRTKYLTKYLTKLTKSTMNLTNFLTGISLLINTLPAKIKLVICKNFRGITNPV